MRVKDLIEELTQIEKEYGNLHLNRYDRPVYLRIHDDYVSILGGDIDE